MSDNKFYRSNRKRKNRNNIFLYPYLFLTLYAIVITIISYIAINTNSQIYDYPFHMARIVGLAQSISNNDILPNLNFLFAKGAGYAVSMFYGNAILYIPALVYLITKVGTISFASYAFIIILATTWTSYYSLNQITNNNLKSILFGMTMATTFPFFGFGMTAISPFIPFLIYCLYKVLFMERLNPVPLAITIALMVQTHIISTLVLAISSLLFVIFSINKLTLQKILSFICSVVLSLGLSIGFILQYLEQSKSQIFFVSWGLRDYPFPTQSILLANNIVRVLIEYYFPIALLFLVGSIFLIKKLNQASVALLLTSIILLLAASDILPWQSMLRFTFLTVFQYTTRLIYFLPAFIIMAIFMVDTKYVAQIVAAVQIVTYLITQPFLFLPHSSNYKERYGLVASNIEVMRSQNHQATEAFTNPFLTTYWTSGNEYFNLNINHEHVQDGTINNFEFDSTKLSVTNIEQSYNNLEFDVKLEENTEDALIVVPKIWYKGYQAFYSNGSNGTQPKITYDFLSHEELQQYKEAHKPKTKKKALYDGRATIQVNKSGHVRISYRKTKMQIFGFSLEIFAWLSIMIYSIFKFQRKEKYSI